MQQTLQTSTLYSAWPQQVAHDLAIIKTAIQEEDFIRLAQTAEANCLAMHATMHAARPAIYYSLAETVTAMQKIWRLRAEGLAIYFTQDAGPNLKLLFQEKDKAQIAAEFPKVELIHPFQISNVIN